jgi:hypothetical protein
LGVCVFLDLMPQSGPPSWQLSYLTPRVNSRFFHVLQTPWRHSPARPPRPPAVGKITPWLRPRLTPPRADQPPRPLRRFATPLPHSSLLPPTPLRACVPACLLPSPSSPRRSVALSCLLPIAYCLLPLCSNPSFHLFAVQLTNARKQKIERVGYPHDSTDHYRLGRISCL